jgi:uncharacterized protein with HEPN domain
MLPRECNYLLDLLNAAKLAQNFVADVDWESFQLDLMRQAAVLPKNYKNSIEV